MLRRCLACLLLVACGDDTVTTTFADTGTSSSSAGTSSSSAGPSSATSELTGEVSTAAGLTEGPTGSSGPETTTTLGGSTSSATDTSSSTGGTSSCGAPGELVDAALEHVGAPAPCGPLEFTGQRVSDPKGPTWALDGCPCDADCFQEDPWTFSLTIPADHLPELPACPRIVVDRVEGFGGCEFAAVSIWDAMTPAAPAFFHAGRGFAATAAAQAELTLGEVARATCPCEGCCGDALLWALQFDLLGQQALLDEGETQVLGAHRLVNFESHSSGLCDAPLSVHWAAGP